MRPELTPGPAYRDHLEHLFRTAVAAAMPAPAVKAALDGQLAGQDPYLLAVGKAALPMTMAALEFLRDQGRNAAAGLVVCPTPAPIDGVEVIAGDHPLPGTGSARAASAIDTFCRRIPAGAQVWVLLSGGATSLIGGPDEGLTLADVRGSFDALLRSGLDIGTMNAVRKRLTRWGGGKLALAMRDAQVLQLIVSDVIGDDLAAIGSGPMVADPTPTAEVLRLLSTAPVALPVAARHRLAAIDRGEWPELPGPGDPAFRHVRTRIIVSNRVALEAVAREAGRMAWMTTLDPRPLEGEASGLGRNLVGRLAGLDRAAVPQLVVIGGEPTVTLGPEAGRGGRAQELVLAAAVAMAERAAENIIVLAGGTDGRDGPTDAAGAVADGTTWDRIRQAGLDPTDCLRHHDSYTALAAAGALLRTGETGTNVMDVVLGLRLPEPE